MKIKKIAPILAVLILLIAGIGIYQSKANATQTAGDQKVVLKDSAPVAVNVREVKKIVKNAEMTYKATLKPNQEAVVSSKVGGKIIEVLFENGQAVKAGDALIKIDDKDIRNNMASTQAQMAVAQTQIENAQNQLKTAIITLGKLQANLNRTQQAFDLTKTLYESGVVTLSEYEGSEFVLNTAKSDLESGKIGVQSASVAVKTATANLELAKVSYKTLTDTLANTIIKAPVNGVIDEKAVTLGQFISPGLVLAKVKDINTLDAVFKIEQDKVKYIKKGIKAGIILDDQPGKVYNGVVESIDIGADEASRTFGCRIHLDNKAMSLHPGTYAKAVLKSEQTISIMTIPIQALNGSEGKYYVFVCENGKAKKKDISVSNISDITAEISSGINEKDKLIVSNLNILQDGDPVTATEQEE